ncbi:hypothetical protein GCM10028857_03150 [Salinarchaeum chitinilyticum]
MIDAEQDGRAPSEILQETDSDGIPARELYAGKQQRRITDAVRILRENGHEVQRWFISAGFGLVDETDELPPYDATFSGASSETIQQRSRELGITAAVVEQISVTDIFDIVFLPLGADYYSTLDLDRVYAAIPDGTTIVVFNREDDQNLENVVSIPARTKEAKRHGVTVIELKGTYLKQFASRLGKRNGPLDADTIEVLCREEEDCQSNLGDLGTL